MLLGTFKFDAVLYYTDYAYRRGKDSIAANATNQTSTSPQKMISAQNVSTSSAGVVSERREKTIAASAMTTTLSPALTLIALATTVIAKKDAGTRDVIPVDPAP